MCNSNPMLSSFPVNQPSLMTNNQGVNMRENIRFLTYDIEVS